MIYKFEIDSEKGNIIAHFEGGSLADLLAAVTESVAYWYAAIRQSDKPAAEAYRRALVGALQDEDSPAWSNETIDGIIKASKGMTIIGSSPEQKE